jgi:HlyD family secretion protein
MKRLKISLALIAFIAILALVFKFSGISKAEKSGNNYIFGTLHQGDIRSVISSTGTLEPIETVEIGTQVSGVVARLLVDFNSEVRKGDLLAELDTLILKSQVQQAEAELAKSQAQATMTQKEYEKSKKLFTDNLISDTDLTTSETNYERAVADVKMALVTLERAKTNLNYAKIYAPINGIVIERNIDAGQTVASSFSTPKLFVIARDLSKMQILAYVDESDIGQITQGMKAEFTVPAFPNMNFYGEVTQIRLQPQTVSNVVNYIVVVRADNSSGKLLPGMTATVEFLLDEAHGVLLAPNSALRMKPSEAMLKILQSQPEERKSEGEKKFEHHSEARIKGLPIQGVGRIWYLDSKGKLKVVQVQTGISDGKFTEIKPNGKLWEDMQIIISPIGGSSNKTSSTETNMVKRQQQRLGLF